MGGFSKNLKIRIVMIVIVAMCVMNFSPMAAYASEGAAFEKAVMTINGREQGAIRHRGDEPFVLDLQFEGFTGELGNINVNAFFDKEGFASITATGAAVGKYINANDNGNYYKADNLNSWYAGTYEVMPRQGASGMTMAFVPSNEQALISVDWYGDAGGNLNVTLRPGSAASADYSILPDFLYANEHSGIGTAGEFAVFANYFFAANDYEGNIAVRRAELLGGGQFGVTSSCNERGYTGSYVGQMVRDDWGRIVKQVTENLVLGTDASGNQIRVTKDNGGEWLAYSFGMQPRKFSARDDLEFVFLLDELLKSPAAQSKAIDFDRAFGELANLAGSLMGRKTLGIIRLDDGSFAVSGREEEALSPDSVSDIVIEGNQITVICKEGINNIVGIAADVLADDRQNIHFKGEDGSSDYSVILNITGAKGTALSLDNPFVDIDGRVIDPGYEIYAGRILLNFGTYGGEVRLAKTHAGAVLAPCASVTAGSTHNGSVIADSVYVDGEIHKNKFQWFDPTPTPMPTNTPTPTSTVTPTPTPSGTPTPGPTPWTSITPEPTSEVTPTPTEEVTPTPPGEETPTPTPTEEVTPTPPVEETPTPTPTEEVTPTPPEEETPTPTPTEEVTPTPPGEETPTPTPTEEVTPTPPEEETPTPTPTEEVTPTPPEEETPTPTPTEEVTPTPPGEETPTPTPTEEVTPTPPEEETPIPTPTPFYNIPTEKPTETPTPTQTPTRELTPTPSPTIWTPRIEPSLTPLPTDFVTSTPGTTLTQEPRPTDHSDTPTPDVPVPTPEMEVFELPPEETPLGTPDPSKPDEEITVIDPEDLLEILDDVPLGIPVAQPEDDPEEIEIEDETPEGLPKTGVASTGLFVAIGMAMMSFGAALGLGGKKKKDGK